MQKKLIALAIAGLASSAAFAQTNVTIYGLVDMGVVRVDADGKNSGWKIDNGLSAGSRLGFKGAEDLGGGLKAIFTLEYMLMPDVNSALGSAGDWSGSATRQAYVGLTGNWGTVTAGRLQGAGFNFACAHNPVAGGVFDTIGKLNGGSSLIGCGSAGRYNNAFAYVSPNWGGFTVEYNHSRTTENATLGAGVTDVEDNYANLLRGNYTNGPFSASLIWSQLSGDSKAATTSDIDEWGAGADYNFGIAKLHGTYQDKDQDGVKLGTDGDKWAVGVSIPAFKTGNIMLSYADFDSDVKGWDADAWTLGYTHGLSKRTTLYGGYSSVSNSSLNVSASAATRGVPKAGGDANLWTFGMRHTF